MRNSSVSDVMMTSSNGNIFRVTGHLCGEFTGPRWIPHTKASDAELWCLYFVLRPNKRLSKQSWGWWFETLSHPLWRHRNVWQSRFIYYQTAPVGPNCDQLCQHTNRRLSKMNATRMRPDIQGHVAGLADNTPVTMDPSSFTVTSVGITCQTPGRVLTNDARCGKKHWG